LDPARALLSGTTAGVADKEESWFGATGALPTSFDRFD
jgi:hypothetical protein